MTALPMHRIRKPISWAASIAFTALRAASSRPGIIAAPTALSPTEAGRTQKMTAPKTPGRKRALRIAGAPVGPAVAVWAWRDTEGGVAAGGSHAYIPRHSLAIY